MGRGADPSVEKSRIPRTTIAEDFDGILAGVLDIAVGFTGGASVPPPEIESVVVAGRGTEDPLLQLESGKPQPLDDGEAQVLQCDSGSAVARSIAQRAWRRPRVLSRDALSA